MMFMMLKSLLMGGICVNEMTKNFGASDIQRWKANTTLLVLEIVKKSHENICFRR